MSRLLLSILICCCYIQLVTSQNPRIIQPPQSQSVCEGGAVNFTCVVMFTNTTPTAASWLTNNGDGSVTGLPGHTPIVGNTAVPPPANITNVLVVTNARLIDDERDYICQQGIHAISEPVLLTVFAPPIAPNSTTITSLTTTSFTVSWTITNPNYNYIVTWTNLHTGMMSNVTVPENTNSYMVTGLNGVDNYNVSVTANNSCGMMMSDPATVYDIPSAVMKVRIMEEDITGGSFVVRWDEVMDIFTITYNVTWYGDSGIIGMNTVNSPPYTVTGLTANTYYNVTVVAINTCCGAGPVSDVDAMTIDTTVMFSQSMYIVSEYAGQLQIMVLIIDPLPNEAIVPIDSSDDSPTSDGSATGDLDYMPGPYNATFSAGVKSALFSIRIINDNITEENEMFMIEINPSSLPNGVMIASSGQAGLSRASVMIVDDDGNSTTRGSSDSDNTGLIIGIIIAVIVVIIVIIIIIVISYYIYKKKKDPKDDARMELKSPTSTSEGPKMGKASVQPSEPSSVPHQTAASGEEYAVTAKVVPRQQQQQPPAQEYAVVDKSKKASASQGVTYADLQALPSSGNAPPPNQGPTSTYAMVA